MIVFNRFSLGIYIYIEHGFIKSEFGLSIVELRSQNPYLYGNRQSFGRLLSGMNVERIFNA